MFNETVIPLLNASWETIYMVFISSFISILLGLILGSVLFLTSKKQVLENALLHRILGSIVNVTRSVPFIILMISVIPFTRMLIGTTIGINAAIVPLTIAAIPFFARVCENALAEVPYGLTEAVNAMGASTWHLMTKVLIPESLPALIRGATLTIIGLIGYSAMAGVVGGGGLGELAINYGYQRFDIIVMLETVIILIVMVQLIQVMGDFFAKKRRIKIIFFSSILFWIICIAYQIALVSFQEENVLRVGVMSGWSEEVMKVAAEVAEKEHSIHLKIVPFSDYVQPNTALNNKSIDVNVFQHIPYLQEQVKAHNYKLIGIAKTFVYPMGFYSKRIQKISELKNHAIIAIPNDPSNCSRALLLLQKYGLIQLKQDVGVLATIRDIVVNDHYFQFKLIDAAQLGRVLSDVDMAAITNDFVGPAGLIINQAVIKEGGDSLYANVIVVREQDKANANIQKFISVMHSSPVVQETEKIFPNGAAIPAWGS